MIGPNSVSRCPRSRRPYHLLSFLFINKIFKGSKIIRKTANKLDLEESVKCSRKVGERAAIINLLPRSRTL